MAQMLAIKLHVFDLENVDTFASSVSLALEALPASMGI